MGRIAMHQVLGVDSWASRIVTEGWETPGTNAKDVPLWSARFTLIVLLLGIKYRYGL